MGFSVEMDNPSKNIRADEHPLVFVSSFNREMVEYAHYKDSPLWQLRQRLAALNDDATFKNSLPQPQRHRLTWVAEEAKDPIIDMEGGDRFAVVDRLVEVLRNAELYVCILADHRTRDGDHGSLVELPSGEATSVSYFEIELYAAALYGKKPVLFVLDGFEPGPRLRTLLEILGWAIPDWRELRSKKADDIFRDIKELIHRHCSTPPKTEPPLRKRLIEAFYRARSGQLTLSKGEPSLFFLNGSFEDRPLPEKALVEKLIREYRSAKNFQKKLNRLWFAVRELMPASYLPADVQCKSILKEFLPYWDCVLGDWAAAAKWHGWHGHLYAGTIAPLNSQALIRSSCFQIQGEFQPQIVLPPDGALASAYYSIAGLLGFGFYYWKCLHRAGQHVKRALKARGGPTDNLLALRGSIRLRMGLWPGAVADFTKMLQLREATGTEAKIADALMHLGTAYAFFPFFSNGRNLLHKSVEILSKYPDDPNLPRAQRKLAFAYKLAGKFTLAKDTLHQAKLNASRLAAYDQLDR